MWAWYSAAFLREANKLAGIGKLAAPAVALAHVCYLASITVLMKHPPLTTISESVTTLAFMIVLIHVYIELRTGSRSGGMPIFFLAFILQGVSSIYMNFAPGVPRMMSNPLLMMHVALALMGYAAFGIAFLYSVMYLMLRREIKSGNFGLMFRGGQSLEELDEVNFRASLAGVGLLTVSIILGFTWSQISFGQLPFGDPKVMMTVFTALVYCVVLVFKTQFGWHGKRIAVLSICGFLLVIISIVVVNVMPLSFHTVY